MDANEWNVFSQLLRQTGNAKKDAGYGSSEDPQFQHVPIGFDAQGSAADAPAQYAVHLSTDDGSGMNLSGLSYPTSEVSSLFPDKTSARLSNRQQTSNSLNGANAVKSLLTGQQYVQSNKKQQLGLSSLEIAEAEPDPHQLQMSHLQSSYQPNETNISSLAGKLEETITPIISNEAFSENLAAGEKVYVLVDGITYEIVSGSNQELMAQPSVDGNLHLAAAGMSLEHLASVSAEQESLKPADTEANMIHQAQLGLELLQGVALQDESQSSDTQRYLQLQQQSQMGAAVATDGQEGMQIIMMPSDGDAMTAGTNSLTGGGDVVKLGLQDYMLQTGQSLPAELQELVARGIDLSNCEFVIQEDDMTQHNSGGVYLSSSGEGSQFHGAISTDLQQQLASVMNASNIFTNQLNLQTGYGDAVPTIAVVDAGSGAGNLGSNLSSVSSSDVLALLASTAVANQEQQQQQQQQAISLDPTGVSNHVSTMPLIAPEDEDDGEFAYLVMEQQDAVDSQLLPLRPNPCDAFLKSFLGFIQGNKPETLSSVANSTITNRPPLPLYDPDLCRRPTRTFAQQHLIPPSHAGDAYFGNGQKMKTTKAPVNVSLVYTDPTGPSLVGGDGYGGAPSGPISVTPFIVQNIDGKSVVLPNSEMQKFLSKQQQQQQQQALRHDKALPHVNLGGSRVLSSRKTKDPFCRIITRKLKGSDDDSLGDSEQDLAPMACMSDSDSDPAWKPASEDIWLKKYGQQPVEVGKPARGRFRGKGKPPRTTATGELTVPSSAAMTGAASGDATSASVGYILQVGSETNSGLGSSSAVNHADAHDYQKGDFVVERKDLYNHGGFPLWKIETGRLLQKYEPFKSELGNFHKSASIYSSWSGDIRSVYKAVAVEMINTVGRRSETVRVLDEFVPHPPDDSLEQDALMELFNIYIQDVLSQALDPIFLSTVMEQQEEYYLGPLRQIDCLLVEAQQTLMAQISWKEKFKSALDQCPYFQLTNAPSQTPENLQCQAIVDSSCTVVKTVKFYGPSYNSDLLQVAGEVSKLTAETFYIGEVAAEHLPVYHALHHYKFLLFRKCEEEVQYLRLKRDKTDEVILGECLQNRIFVQQCLRELKQLLEKCSIVITVVTKAEDGADVQMATQ